MKTRNRSDNNHCLRFETYTSRKPLNKTIIYNTDIRTELPNYYTSKYIKNNIDFNRNKSTLSYLEKLIIKEKNPPLGFYEPKYNYVFNTKYDDLHSPENIGYVSSPVSSIYF